MDTPFFGGISLPSAMTLLAFLAGVCMVVGGAALIGSVLSKRRDFMTSRINLTHPQRNEVRPYDSAKIMQEEMELVRNPVYGLSERERREIVRQGTKLGISHQSMLAFFNVTRGMFAVVLGVLIFFLTMTTSLFVIGKASLLTTSLLIVVVVLGWMIPKFYIHFSARKRALAAAAGLPDALELLVVCVEAGLALGDGIDRIVIELKHSRPEISEELAIASADIKILPSRDQALANLAERIDTPSVRAVVSTLSQTLRYGTPLAQAMRVVAADMRNDSLVQLEEQANRLPVMMTVPMMLLIMPAIFLIIGGPAVLKLVDHFLQYQPF